MAGALAALFDRPANEAVEAWLARICETMLRGHALLAGDRAHRFAELEVYYHGPGHRDPFAHAHPVQLALGRWYFHRASAELGAGYRGGSFKGIDLTFGDGVSTGGILIRSLAKPDGTLVVGPSLSVDHLLTTTGFATIAELDRAIAHRDAWDARSPLCIASAEPSDKPIYRSRRVGLTLKRHNDALAVDRLGRLYRFLNEPRRIHKGRKELVEALLAEGKTLAEIKQLTGARL